MNATELIRLLKTDHYSPANLEDVNDICRNYPMFNLAHALKVRIETALGHAEEDAVRIAAIYAGNRSRLYQLVNEVKPSVREEDRETEQRESDGIQFSEEPTEQADVIIVQHAPYAAPDPDDHLLELDEQGFAESSGSGEEEGRTPLDEATGSGEVSEAENERELSSEEPSSGDVADGEAENERELSSEEPRSGDVADGEAEERELSSEEPRSGDVADGEAEERELSSEDLVGVVVKDETDMEEPMPEGSDVPAIDVVEPEEGGEEEPEPQPETPESKQLIEQFIRGEPGPIRADREISLKGDVSVASIREHDGFITDTLAKIYVKQGLYAKAIYAYEKLSLKYPEKSAYFAAQIDKIKNITQS